MHLSTSAVNSLDLLELLQALSLTDYRASSSLLSDIHASGKATIDIDLARFRTARPQCGICGQCFLETNSPVVASRSTNSSPKPLFGLRLPCPSRHSYCTPCLSQYIMRKLDVNSKRKIPRGKLAFPIRCPKCPSDAFTKGIQNETAEKVLTNKNLVTWVCTDF